jgi:hypothetical protein
MSLLMQGGTNAYSPLVVLKYLRARPDMRERVEQWRRAGAKVLAERKSTRQAEARVHELLETARRQAERQVLARRLALSHITGLTAHERFSIQLANRLVAAAEQEPDWTKRIDMLGEAYALLDF